MAELTPMMQQYRTVKERNPDCILFFRLGDFYEMFDEDARIASRELDLTLTSRDHAKDKAPEDKVPMCGVPFHSSESYIARLVQKGDYAAFDYLIGMDRENLSGMRRVFGADPEGKLRLLLSFAGKDRDVADPWYTDDFEAAYRDIDEGCRALLAFLLR